jgi:hypothetical protein
VSANRRSATSFFAAPVQLKKRILRTLIEEIVVDVDERKQELVFRIHWNGGVHSTVRAQKNRRGKHQRTTDRQVVELVRELAQVCADRSIASILNRLGYETGAGNNWTESRVRSLRSSQQIPVFDKDGPRVWITMADAAAQLKVSPSSVRKMIEREILPARQVVRHAPWLIKSEDLQRAEVRAYLSGGSTNRKTPRHDSGQSVMSL